MRKGRASWTALAVASARALASGTRAALIDPHDRAAERLLPGFAAHALERLHQSELGRGLLARGAALVSLGMVDHLALRSAIIDKRIEHELLRGVEQLVIVGAGFDTRAYRMPALAAARVFEVDHPDSQRGKRERAGSLPLCARAIEYVALDLERAGLAQQLAAAGHRAEAPSFWLLEGLVPYLEPATVDHVLAEIERTSARGSALLITYVTPDLIVLRRTTGLVQAALELAGEPIRCLLRPDELALRLAAHGFSLEEDSDTEAWADELVPDARSKPLIAYEHMALARR